MSSIFLKEIQHKAQFLQEHNTLIYLYSILFKPNVKPQHKCKNVESDLA